MAEIKLVRIDDRLIHGQVVTRWIQETGCNRIIIIDDDLSKNEFLKNIYQMSAPKNIPVDTKSVDEFIEEWKEEKIGNYKLLILLKTIDTLKRLVEKEMDFNEIQIGGLGSGPKKKVVFKTVSLTKEDAENLKYIRDKGVDIYFQILPGEKRVKLQPILSKYFKDIC